MVKLLVKQAIRNIFKHWKQSVVAILSMSSVLVCYINFQAYQLHTQILFKNVYEKKMMYGDLIVQKKGKSYSDYYNFNLDFSTQKKLIDFFQNQNNSKSKTIRSYLFHLDFQLQISNNGNQNLALVNSFDVTMSKPFTGIEYAWDTFFGTPIRPNSNEVTISLGLAKKLNCSFSSNIQTLIRPGLVIRPGERNFFCPDNELILQNATEQGQLLVQTVPISGVIDGIYTDLDDMLVKMNLKTGQALFGKNEVSRVSLLLTDSRFKSNIKEIIESKFPDLEVSSFEHHEVGSIYRKTMSLFNMFSNFVLVILLVITFFILFNTSYKIITQRKQEIALYLTLGFRHFHIQLMTLIEGQFLVIFSSVIAVFIYLITSLSLTVLQIQYSAGLLAQPVVLDLIFPLRLTLLAILILAILNACINIILLRYILKKDIVEIFHT